MPEAAPVPAATGDAPLYEWKGRSGPFPVRVPPDVFTPSRTSLILADALEIRPGDTVLDVGCGSGVLSLVAARLGAARVVGCDASAAAVRCAQANARLLGLAAVTEFRAGHLLEPVRALAAGVVIADVSGVPHPIARAPGCCACAPSHRSVARAATSAAIRARTSPAGSGSSRRPSRSRSATRPSAASRAPMTAW
jgi:SAM-dependent methyltransferase